MRRSRSGRNSDRSTISTPIALNTTRLTQISPKRIMSRTSVPEALIGLSRQHGFPFSPRFISAAWAATSNGRESLNKTIYGRRLPEFDLPLSGSSNSSM